MNEKVCGMSNNYLDPSDEETLSYVESLLAKTIIHRRMSTFEDYQGDFFWCAI